MTFPQIPGCEFYLCGGAVRDKLLNRPNKDNDYVVITNMPFDQLCNMIEMHGGKIFQAKPEFLTIRTRIDDEVIDITYPRVDGEYKDGRRPEGTSMTKSLYQDSRRRDFTINSLYEDKDGNIIDYNGGQADLRNRIIRCVGEPKERFKEDYLRILRCIRFAIQLNFSIDHETYKQCQTEDSWNGLLNSVGSDRIREETNKMLRADTEKTIKYMSELYLFGLLEKKGLHLEVSAKEV